MWKTIVLCASLFAGAAVGLAVATDWLEPTALPATAALGLCLIGVVLILVAPTAGRAERTADEAPPLPGRVAPLQGVLVASSSGNAKAHEGAAGESAAEKSL